MLQLPYALWETKFGSDAANNIKYQTILIKQYFLKYW